MRNNFIRPVPSILLVTLALAVCLPALACAQSYYYYGNEFTNESVQSTSAACDAATKGAIRYNGATSVFEACNGTSWGPLTGAAATGATGDIQFNSGAAFTANTNFVWDNTNGRLGIGNSSPNALLDIGNDGTTLGTLRLEDSSAGHYVQFQPSASATASATYTLPVADGSSGQVLSTNGSGVLSWITGGGAWSSLTNPTANLGLTMGAYTSTFTYNNATGSSNMFALTDTANNSGTGAILFVSTASGSHAAPLRVSTQAGAGNLVFTSAGRLGIGTATPGEMLFLSGGNLVDATTLPVGSASLPALSESGAGTRMMWYPKKAAFRAGASTGTNWDDANIGNYSVAMGNNSYAKGVGSVALGAGYASGDYSFAVGNGIAEANGSAAFGAGDAMGGNSVVTGDGSAAGQDAFSAGASEADGTDSAALGSSYASNTNSFSANEASAMGLDSTSFGSGATYGTGSFSTGSALAYGNTSMALGQYVKAGTTADTDGNYSMAIGLTNTNITNWPEVTGSYDMGVFMGDQHNDVISGSNIAAFLGGDVYIDPTTGGGKTVSSARATLDLGNATDAILLPSGTTAQEPSSPVVGMIRYNSTNNSVEAYQGSTPAWVSLGGGAWSSLTNPTANLGLTMGAYTSTFTYNNATGSSNMFALTDTANNSGTGAILFVSTASGSHAAPLRVSTQAGAGNLVFTSAGRLGIDTASPSSDLQLGYAGDGLDHYINFAGSSNRVGRPAAGNMVIESGGSVHASINTDNTGTDYFQVTNGSSYSPVFSVDSSGIVDLYNKIGSNSGDMTIDANLSGNGTVYMYDSVGVAVSPGAIDAGAALETASPFYIKGATSGYVGFAVPAAAGSTTYTWPSAAPTSNMVLQSDSTGTLSWVASGSAAGSNTQIQFNSGGSFGGSSGLTWSGSALAVTAANIDLDSTTHANPYGIIYKSGGAFISDFNYGNNGTVTTVGYNTFVGMNAGNLTMGATASLNTDASYNTGLGYGALHFNSTGYENTASGYQALYNNTTGNGNTAIGMNALEFSSAGSYNTAIGMMALQYNTTGHDNTAIGMMAGQTNSGPPNNMSSNDSVYIGDKTAALVNGDTNEIVIGYGANGLGSNSAVLGNSSISKTELMGNVGIGTATPGELLFVSGGNLVDATTDAVGSASLPTIAESGAGTRMMWYPKKAAFRAGNVAGTDWDDANIGTYSTAFGSDSIASGSESMAWGEGSNASGPTSTAWGYGVASGLVATAWGEGGQASGEDATAWGPVSQASGQDATAWDSGRATAQMATAWDLGVASGFIATAWGNRTTASGMSSTAWGYNTSAYGSSSTALGQYVMAGDTADTNGMYSMAIGLTNTSTTPYAEVTGTGSMGIFMQDQHSDNISGDNIMALMGGDLYIDPTTGGGLTVSSALEALDVHGRIHMAQGTAPGTTTDRLYNVGGTLYWNGTALGGSGGGGPIGSDTQIAFNSGGTESGSSSLIWDHANSALTVTGDINYSGIITDTSDIRLKRDIHPLSERGDMLDKLMQVNTYSYIRKSNPNHRVEYGVIAQQLKTVFPDLVHTAKDGQHTESVNYTGLIPPLIESVKELKAQDDSLRTSNSQLRADNDAMRNKLERMSADIDGLKAFTGYGTRRAGFGEGAITGVLALLGLMFAGRALRCRA